MRDLFADDLLASLYDWFNPWSAGDDFYLEIAHAMGGRVLDLGCGTGMLACRLATGGLDVTGVDPAEAMLRVARSRPGGDRVTWVQSAGQDLQLERRFELVYMTGHAFQALLTDPEALALLVRVREHLSDAGRLVFETRNPARKAWRDWAADRSGIVETAEYGRVKESCVVFADEAAGLVDLTHHYRFETTGELLTGCTQLRFRDREQVRNLLIAAGLTPREWFGDWDRSVLTEASPEIIVFASC